MLRGMGLADHFVPAHPTKYRHHLFSRYALSSKYRKGMSLTSRLSDPPDAQPAANFGGKNYCSAPPLRVRDCLADPEPSEQLMFQREFALRYVVTRSAYLPWGMGDSRGFTD